MTNKWLKKIDQKHWRSDRDQRSSYINFLPILSFGSGTLQIAISDIGEWIVKSDSAIYFFSSDKNLFILLSLLEKKYEDLQKEFHEAITDKNGDPESAWQTFPVKRIILAGLLQESDYWAKLSLGWIPFLAIDQRDEFIDALNIVAKSKWASQSVRHQAYGLLKQIERNDRDLNH